MFPGKRLLGAGLTVAIAASVEAQVIDYSYDLSGNLFVVNALSAGTPTIIGQPQVQVAQPGDLASFSVVLADASGVGYQWLFNGTNLAGQGGDALVILHVSTNNQGLYSVVVSNNSGSVTSSVAQLYIAAEVVACLIGGRWPTSAI